jgi:hypothetical protein
MPRGTLGEGTVGGSVREISVTPALLQGLLPASAAAASVCRLPGGEGGDSSWAEAAPHRALFCSSDLRRAWWLACGALPAGTRSGMEEREVPSAE